MAMRKLQVPLNQTQKVRYDRAMERLESLSSTENCVIVNDSIPFNEEGSVLRGNGVSKYGELEATVCGVVERVSNLVHVRHSRARYTPVDKDTVVGRVIEVAGELWRVDINSPRNEVLWLKSMNTNCAVQKVNRSGDELNLRNILAEHDVVCAQVCKNRDKVELKANMSHNYGKLEKGQLLKVEPYLIKETSHHIHYLENLGIELIIGRNGFIWVGECRDPIIVGEMSMVRCSTKNIGKEQSHDTPLETRHSICKTANAIRVLSNLGFTMTREVIEETVNLSNTENIDIYDMLGSEFHVLVAEKEVERRGAYRRKRKSMNQT